MADIYVHKGERVMSADTGKVICEAIEDIERHSKTSAKSFGNFTDGETPWRDGEKMDPRCTRIVDVYPDGAAAVQLFVEGAWRGHDSPARLVITTRQTGRAAG